MTDSTSTPDWDSLLKHSGWVRALAQNLVSDASAAEDIEQQAWLKAAEKPPHHKTNLRAWLATLVRSKAGMYWRRQRPTSSFIEDLDSPGACESVVERLDTVRNLAAAVASLPEPYASAIYMRYFEELSVREVAERQGVPLNTAQTRLSRGLDKLRIKLEGSLGADWRNQCLVFAAPLSAAPSVALGTTTAILMTAKTKLILAAALVMMASLGVLQPWETSEPAPDSPSAVASMDTHTATASNDLPADVVVERSEFVNATGADSSLVGGGDELIVHVIDGFTLLPIPNAEVLLFDYSASGDNYPDVREHDFHVFAKSNAESRLEKLGVPFTTNAQGEIRIPRPGSRFEIAARGDGKFGWQMGIHAGPGGNLEIELPIFDVTALHVRVFHQDGEPAEGISVGFAPRQRARASFAYQKILTGKGGRAVFRHVEIDLFGGQALSAATVAVAVPSAKDLSVEFPITDPPTEELIFRLPALGSVVVECKDSNGVPFSDGSEIGLQAGEPWDPESSWLDSDYRIAQGRRVALVSDGIATFVDVGVGTNLVFNHQYPGRFQQTLISGPGPKQAGDEVRFQLIMEALGPRLQLRLVDENQVPRATRFCSLHERYLDANGEPTYESAYSSTDENGDMKVFVDWALQRGFDHICFLLMDADGPRIGSLDFALFRHDFEEEGVREGSEPVLVPFGDKTLVGGRCVDNQGDPIAGMELHLFFYDRDIPLDRKPPSLGVINLNTDADGNFRYNGSFDSTLFRAELHVPGDANNSNYNRTKAVPFEIGQSDLTIVRRGQVQISGRLLVDDSAFLSLLQIQMLVEESGAEVEYIGSTLIQRPSGRFQKLEGIRGNQVLVAMDRTSRVVLARWENPPLSNILEDGSIGIPDWDLRGILHNHMVEVTDAKGNRLENSRAIYESEGRTRSADKLNAGGFLSLQSQLNLTVTAPGFRKKTLISTGESSVALDKGIEVHLSLAPGVELPSGDTWSIRLRKTRNGEMRGSLGEKRQKLLSSNDELLFVLDEPGEWGVILNRGVRMENEYGWWTTDYWFPFSPKKEWHPINVEDTDAHQSFVLPVTAEGFESMLE